MAESEIFDVIILGAGAAGLMCAKTAGERGRKVLVLEQNRRIGRKILASGGGKCNFSNTNISSNNYISRNPMFTTSALSRFTTNVMIEWLNLKLINWEEREQGRLFCTGSSGEIVNNLHNDCRNSGVLILTEVNIGVIEKNGQKFKVHTQTGFFESDSLVIATGGISWPVAGVSRLGYEIARQFELTVTALKPGLAPMFIDSAKMPGFSSLAGIAVEAIKSGKNYQFQDQLLFTHNGISGPAVLQASNYWQPGEFLIVNLLPGADWQRLFENWRETSAKSGLKKLMIEFLPARLVEFIISLHGQNKPITQFSVKESAAAGDYFQKWRIHPLDRRNWRKAEITAGGVDTGEISSKTFEAKKVPGLYFIGEVLDVTGWLGGYNLHWAWASGFCAGQYV